MSPRGLLRPGEVRVPSRHERRAPGRARARAAAVRRPHRRRDQHRVGDPRLPLGDRPLGASTTRWSTRRSTRSSPTPPRSGTSTASGSTSLGDGGAERRPPRARRARGARAGCRRWSRRTSTGCTRAPARAGLVEVHGSLRTVRLPRLRRASLGRDVILELLPEPALPRAADRSSSRTSSCSASCSRRRRSTGRSRLARGARLLLVVGSSLEVYPVAGLPAGDARRRRGARDRESRLRRSSTAARR